jgi:hypothetical protein
MDLKETWRKYLDSIHTAQDRNHYRNFVNRIWKLPFNITRGISGSGAWTLATLGVGYLTIVVWNRRTVLHAVNVLSVNSSFFRFACFFSTQCVETIFFWSRLTSERHTDDSVGKQTTYTHALTHLQKTNSSLLVLTWQATKTDWG